MGKYKRKEFGKNGWETITFKEIKENDNYADSWEKKLENNEIIYTHDYLYKLDSTSEPKLKFKNRTLKEEIVLIRNKVKDGKWEETKLENVKDNLKGYSEYIETRLLNGEIINYPDGQIKLGSTEECPICGSGYMEGLGALSRIDNKTEMCSNCGINEGINNYRRGKHLFK